MKMIVSGSPNFLHCFSTHSTFLSIFLINARFMVLSRNRLQSYSVSLKQSIQSLFYFILDITETVCVQLTSLSLVLWCGEISPVFSWRTHGTTCELASGILLWLPQLTCSMQRYFFTCSHSHPFLMGHYCYISLRIETDEKSFYCVWRGPSLSFIIGVP